MNNDDLYGLLAQADEPTFDRFFSLHKDKVYRFILLMVYTLEMGDDRFLLPAGVTV